MFGLNMRVVYEGLTVNLRPFTKADLPDLVSHFNSMRIHMYTMGLYAQTLENEEEWYELNRKEKDSVVWAIIPGKCKKAIGTTGLHHIDIYGSAVSGIIIWDPKWWKKGIATRAHLGRTLFAADYLNRLTIKSAARVANGGSVNALLRVGYNKTGLEPRTFLRAGRFIDTYTLCWIHPERINMLFPEGLPKEYKQGVKNAKTALDLARKVVSFP